MTTGAITSVINRLKQRSIIERLPDANDRRKVIVAARREALAPIDEVYRSMGDDFRKLLKSYSIDEIEFLVRFYQASIEMTKSQIANLSR